MFIYEYSIHLIASLKEVVTGCVSVVGSISFQEKTLASRMLFQIVKPEKLVIKFVWPILIYFYKLKIMYMYLHM